MSKEIIAHWFDLLNIDGWIPREQILGDEARRCVFDDIATTHDANFTSSRLGSVQSTPFVLDVMLPIYICLHICHGFLRCDCNKLCSYKESNISFK